MTYEYLCKTCNTAFEVEQSIKAEAGAECPKCRIFCTNRLVSGGAGFSLKGGGWAADNYSSSKS
jgi:hypothetical protein